MPASKGRYKCTKCPFTTNFSNQYQIHLNQCQPVNRVEAQTEWYCELCNVPTTSKETHKSHLEGAKHRKKAVEAAHMKRVILLTQEDTYISNLPKKLHPGTLTTRLAVSLNLLHMNACWSSESLAWIADLPEGSGSRGDTSQKVSTKDESD